MTPVRVDSPSPAKVIVRWALRAVLLAAAAFLVLMPDARTDQAGHAEAKAVSGEFAQSNSRAGTAIFAASNFGPGHVTGGSVRIANTGRRPGHFVLAQGLLADRVGPVGARLSSALDVGVQETRASGARRQIYRGKLAALRPTYLGIFGAGEARTYSFTVVMPDTGRPATATSGDNRFTEASVRSEYDWVSYEARPRMRGYVPPNRPGPRVRLSTYKMQNALKLKSFTLMVRCDEHCRLRGRISLDHKSARASRNLAHFTRQARANRRIKVRVKLTRRNRKLIMREFRRYKRARVTVDLRATNRLGAATIKRVRIHLKPVKKRSRR